MWPVSYQFILSSMFAVATVLAVLALAWRMRAWRRSAECDAQRMFEQLDLIRAELLFLSERVQGLETPPQTHARPAPPEIRAPALSNAAPRGYEVAARLARGGATCEELISSCGLSRHEAELLIRLHKAEAARAKTAPNTGHLKAAEAPRTRLSVVG
jgi:hypothetical protein